MPKSLPSAKLWFPNIIITLLRSRLPPHQAILKVPQHLTKLDIKTYLHSLYSLKTTDIRTMNYLGNRPSGRMINPHTSFAKFKKVVITMEEDFVFPDVPRDEAERLPFQGGRRQEFRKNMREKVEARRRGEVYVRKQMEHLGDGEGYLSDGDKAEIEKRAQVIQ